jgi:NAD(P)-dependent dehydrogenase (short-subunit alcohol dehydrogenase family)
MTARTVLITGAAQGLGAETARYLAARGWRIIVADLSAEAAQKVVDPLDEAFPVEGGHLALGVDVADEERVGAAFASLGSQVGELNGLVNGAGVLSRMPAEDFDTTSWRLQLDVHLTGAMLCSRFAFPLLKRADSASIVNVASVGSTFGLPGRLAYSTAKSGVLGLTRTLAVEWGPHGIRVNAIAPGYIATEMALSGFRSGALDRDRIIDRTPLGRLGEPAEIASVIAFLLGDESSFVTGAVLNTDGGVTIDGSF